MAAIAVGQTLINTYRVERILGQGPVGTVYMARHIRTGGLRAVKVLPKAVASGEPYKKFLADSRIVATLRHPHILPFVDYDRDENGRAILVMDLVEGENLQQRLKRGPIPVALAVELLKQVGSALHAAHLAGVLHRDLKPENIFLVAQDMLDRVTEIAMVTEFGLGRLRRLLQAEKGPPSPYLPPEAREERQLDGRADQWALGAVAYRLLAGVSPPVDLRADKLAQQAPEAPAFVVQAVMRAMSKNREARFETVLEFVKALAEGEQAPPPLPKPSAVLRSLAEPAGFSESGPTLVREPGAANGGGAARPRHQVPIPAALAPATTTSSVSVSIAGEAVTPPPAPVVPARPVQLQPEPPRPAGIPMPVGPPPSVDFGPHRTGRFASRASAPARSSEGSAGKAPRSSIPMVLGGVILAVAIGGGTTTLILRGTEPPVSTSLSPGAAAGLPQEVPPSPPQPTGPQALTPPPKVVEPPPRVVEPPPKVVEPPPKVVEPPPKVVEPPPKVVEPPPKVVEPPPKVVEPPPKAVEPPPPSASRSHRSHDKSAEEAKALADLPRPRKSKGGEDPEVLMKQAQEAYLGGDQRKAVSLALSAAQQGGETRKVWRFVGTIACSMRDARLAVRAFRNLQGEEQQLLVSLCQRRGLTFSDGQFRHAD